MFLLFDARPYQVRPDDPSVRTVIGWLGDLRKRRDIRLLVDADRPIPAALVGYTVCEFTGPLPATSANADLNGRYLADRIAALDPGGVIHPDPFATDVALPVYDRSPVRRAFLAGDSVARMWETIRELDADQADRAGRILCDLKRADHILAVCDSAADAVRHLLGDECPPVIRLADAAAFPFGFRPAVPARPKRPRIAWVAPAPPSETGVADYALEVADVLADRFDLEWVADTCGPVPSLDVARRYRLVFADEFDARHRADPFDLAVYHLGNNGQHGYMLPLMARHPGLAVVHDAHLGGLYRTTREAGVWPTDWAGELDHNGERLMAAWVAEGLVDPRVTPSLTGFGRRVIDLAVGFVVHSRAAWQTIRSQSDAPAAVVPLLAVPPVVGTRTDERRRLGIPADRFVISTLGIVSATKRVDVILRAVAALPADIRDRAYVLVVGPAGPRELADLTALATDLGLVDRVEFRGKVPLADLPVFAYAADVCVQLRYPSNGETSAALARAMAVGAACVTSDMPSMCDVPNGVTRKVRSPLRDTEDLTAALTKLARDPAFRDRLAANARRYMAETASPAAVAARYAAVIASTIADGIAADRPWRTNVLNALADVPADDVPPGLVDDWAALRTAVRNRASRSARPGSPDAMNHPRRTRRLPRPRWYDHRGRGLPRIPVPGPTHSRGRSRDRPSEPGRVCGRGRDQPGRGRPRVLPRIADRRGPRPPVRVARQ